MNKHIIHNVLFRLLTPIFYGSFTYLILLMINDNLLIINELFISSELVFCVILSLAIFEINRFLIKLIYTQSAISILNILIQLGVNMLMSLVVVYIGLLIYFEIYLGYSSLSGFETEIKSFALIFGITSLLYNILAVSNKLLTTRNEQIYKDEQILREQIEFELENYTAEVNPELLFDSLETALTLIQENSELAEDYIDRLALVYRYILSSSESDLMSLNNEVNAADNLIYLYNAGNDSFIALEDRTETKEVINLIPGSLPLLVNEIIKSNIVSLSRPLRIILDREDNYLTLSHQLNERLSIKADNIKSIERLQAAYSFITDRPLIKVQAYGDAFYKIPILTSY